MARTFTHEFDRDDEDQTPVTVEYTIIPGCSAHMGSMNYAGHPAEPAEVEIRKAWHTVSDVPVTLTDAEDSRYCEYLSANHQDVDDREWESD